ncbi:TPA: thermonuclease family protein [Escherichia coli]
MNGDWLIQTLCLMGSVVGIAFLVSMIRRDGTAGRDLYIFMGLALALVALVYFVADSRQKAAPAAEGQQVAPGTQSPELIGKVVRVLDGDTFELLVDQRPVRIRVTGIDAPEKDQPFGQRSRQSLAGMVDNNPVAVLVRGKDRYGRTLGTVYAKICATSAPCHSVHVNAEQVKAGMAWAYRYGVPFPDLLGNHKAKVRKFNFAAALRFVDQVNKARSEGEKSESS